MLFSSLNNMLPEAQDYLVKGGFSKAIAAWVTIGGFLGGAIGIQFLSRIMHHYIPSHIVDCDHTHDEDQFGDHSHDDYKDDYEPAPADQNAHSSEHTPLLATSEPHLHRSQSHHIPTRTTETAMQLHPDAPRVTEPFTRPSIQPRLASRVTTFISGVTKTSCDTVGPCYGYSDPCGSECVPIATRSPTPAFQRSSNTALAHQPSLLRTATAPRLMARPAFAHGLDEEAARPPPRTMHSQRPAIGRATSSAQAIFRGKQGISEPPNSRHLDDDDDHTAESTHSLSESSTANDISHHHHVPSNAFLAIGLQTSIAIALHKLPEGFITYATNHANPSLGFSVFLALFIHNFTEGFAMALPLYLAINNRIKAMFWSSLLGGVSQPLGAGIAALWFKIAGTGEMKPGDTVYGCMFSITAGIMASVALQLFSESLTLTHNRNICTIFAFGGMGILGVSHALTA